MQKVFRRTVLAERQAARRGARRREKNNRDFRKAQRDQTFFQNRERGAILKQAAINRKEDWELGALAPKRDVGEWKEKYGTVNPHTLRGPMLFGEERYKKLEIFGGKYLNITAGDRVVLLEGRDKGKIGTIKEIDARRAECTIEGLNLVDVSVPKWMINPDDPDQRPIRQMEKPISLPSVRLVHPLTDEATGVTKDVIIKKLVNSKLWHSKEGGVSWSRIVPGLNIKIPWPKRDPKVYEDKASDTLRIDVEAKTFVPTLLTPPMPRSVIDELRNKYSIFRTRHEPAYIAEKEAEENAKEEKKKMAKLMRTPLSEINRKERKLRKAKGKGKLTPDMLERIGKIIAEKRQLAMDAAGVSKEGAAAEPVKAAV
ncbi:Uncharacterized protein BP5553_05487 [Venustampulla echinocandica]|uniref:KOW domain-containing protein n=1 Tax=Venustampulla echinocandica TaxID=2656787 RepID=A0A370TRB8_9HELO|nr:Uncharacterized protein BP5553_05487 [Venustampulla echinocandica]RDL38054.1 Uncharacterized protein BP5553_05487 [Venustampulla echinocandica]